MTRQSPSGEADQLAAALRRIDQLDAALAASHARECALRHELQHRVRNMLGVIRSIYRRSRESCTSQEAFAEHFEGRIGAIARYQTGLVAGASRHFDLEDMIRDELLDAKCLDQPRCTIDGPAVTLAQKHAELIGLALHELSTNAIKFGALAQNGSLEITWVVEPGSGGRRLHFRWAERGVSVVGAAPRPTGFGRQFIEEALPYQLGATTSFELGAGGLICSILLPLPPSELADAADDEPMLASEKDG